MRRTTKLFICVLIFLLIILFRLNKLNSPFSICFLGDDDCRMTQETGEELDHTRELQRLPTVLIIGMRKGGTRALIDALCLNPQVAAARREIHYFDSFYDRGVEWYRSQMPVSSQSQITIEKTPSYITSPKAAQRVYDFNPNMKLLVILRDPVARTISDFTQVQQQRLEKNSSQPVDNFEHVAFMSGTQQINVHYKPIANSLYHQHFRSWLAFFPLSQFHIVDGDLFIKNPLEELKKVEVFLGLKPQIQSNQLMFNQQKGFFCFRPKHRLQFRCLGKTKGRTQIKIDSKLRDLLVSNFRSENEKFFQLIGRRFTWS
ncbi:Sulfotransfer-1 domain-containing protein [Aphelenchoides besseyi]|nr:Sulfotransfer-1 domain-containing protein [Aphelenchoides besseyi]